MELRGIAPHPLGGDGDGDLEARVRDPGVRFADNGDLPEEYMLAPNPRATAIS
jgi:hypothetical protein